MDFSEYQKQSRKTAKYPGADTPGTNYVYPVLGLVGEAGEVAEKMKKVLRDEAGIITDAKKEEIKKELGDVLWYIAQLSTELGLSMDDVAQANLDKLFSRLERGKLHGDGDNR